MGRRTTWFAFLFTLVASWASASETRYDRVAVLESAVGSLCRLADLTGSEAQAAVSGSALLKETRVPSPDAPRLITVRLALAGGDALRIERFQHNGRLRQFRVSYLNDRGEGPKPNLLAIADGACQVRSGRELRTDGAARVYLDQLDNDMTTVRWSETLQVPWPEGNDRGGVRVGLIDSGLAYDLPAFRDRLARDAEGAPLGYDFWDLDPWPYDGDTARGPFLPIRHGTAVASILAREAPGADLVPYRYPRPDMTRMSALLARADEAGIRVLAMPLGSNNREDWTAFEAALEQHDILAIVSAGNDGRDIDAAPVYPAALRSERILTVTSADASGRLANGSNWGVAHVDIMVPAENLPVIDFRGAAGRASGSSYAVPRVAAMAARILEHEPDLSAVALKARIFARAVPSPLEREGVLAVGWIANPLED